MKKFICIFGLLFLASCLEVTISNFSRCPFVIFSDALPVQFWLADCDTYNETVPKGVHEVCFCQPWQCDDEIKIQFVDDEPGPGTESVSLPALSEWSTRSTTSDLEDWTEGAAPEVDLPGAGAFAVAESEILYADYDFIPGREYVITVSYTKVVNTSVSNPRNIELNIYDDFYNEIFTATEATPGDSGGSDSVEITFTATSLCTKIGVVCRDGSDVTVTIDSHSATISTGMDYNLIILDDADNVLRTIPFTSLELEANGYLHSASFTPDEDSPDICDKSIRLEIRAGDTVIAKSDCLQIATVQDETELIEYSNERNFAGLIYQDISPEASFKIRVPCRFFHEEFPQEDEAIELTSQIVTTASQIKTQKMLEVKHAPYYWHKKLQLVLMHPTLEIGGVAYKKEEKYEINKGNPRWPLKSATCLLTEKTSVLRNIL